MKKLQILICLLIALLLFTACGVNDELTKEVEVLRNQLLESEVEKTVAEEEVASLMNRLEEAENAAENMKKDIDSLFSELNDAEAYIEVLNEQLGGKYAVYYKTPDFSKAIFRGEIGYTDPWVAAAPIGIGINSYVDVVAAAEVMDMVSGVVEEWLLVVFSVKSVGEPFTDMGWIKADETEKYTYSNMKEIEWPVTLRSGTVIYTDEALSMVLEQELFAEEFTVNFTENGICQIGSSGFGKPLYVRSEDIIYPEP